ncbi:MAG: RNA degradosome polyphosphate kinase [Defluviitaleaceae bacterium]|nr:RNA degradosome polyphosphate kinase [Defluviitaleaceae bacterium]
MTLTDPSLYVNRELSWLAFNERVLEEAQDKTNPIMERLKFLAITASNLDEFFMVRVAHLLRSESTTPDPAGLTPAQQLAAISDKVHDMVQKQYSCFTRSLVPAMEKENIRFLSYAQLNSTQRAQVDTYFTKVLYQVLTPMAIDQSRPFPTINNRTVNIFVELAPDKEASTVRTVEWDNDELRWRITEKSAKGPKYAVVQVPTVVPRIVPVATDDPEAHHYILLENILLEHIGDLFQGHTVTRTALLRVTRNADLEIDEEEIEDLLDEVSRSLKGRRWGEPVRVEMTKGISKAAMQLLEKALGLTQDKIYEIKGPLDFTAWMGFSMLPEFAKLQYEPAPPQPVPEFAGQKSMFSVIRKKDVLVHSPYMSFDSVVRFVKEAAADPNVLAIKQTLYRVSGQSPIISALIQAAENGKQVTVLVELKARFDEENNVNWARLLEKSGVHVVYGLAGLKTHCKVCLVVRREKGDRIRRYMHLGTGNYNEATAKVYTDIGLFTCSEAFGQDASQLFNVLTGYSKATHWQKFAVAPMTLRSTFETLIEQEIKNALEGKPAAITAKMNSLSNVPIIQLLYKASQAGVKVRLLVRGICCLKPGIPGVSDNITVSSIVGRYLEHSRIYIFENGGQPKVFLASADWMSRNLNRRIEVMFPIDDAGLKKELMTLMEISLSDNVKLRVEQPNGSYERVARKGKTALMSHAEHHKRAVERYAEATRDQFDM